MGRNVYGMRSWSCLVCMKLELTYVFIDFIAYSYTYMTIIHLGT